MVVKDSIEEKFKRLAKAWKNETGYLSSMYQASENKHYQAIINMGWKVVPVILNSLREKPDHWFIALIEITGVNPIKSEHVGIVPEMARDWINWGYSKRLIDKIPTLQADHGEGAATAIYNKREANP